MNANVHPCNTKGKKPMRVQNLIFDPCTRPFTPIRGNIIGLRSKFARSWQSQLGWPIALLPPGLKFGFFPRNPRHASRKRLADCPTVRQNDDFTRVDAFVTRPPMVAPFSW